MIGSMLAPFVVALALGQELPPAPPTPVGAQRALVWDQVLQDTGGNPEDVAGYELALVAPGKDLNTAGTAALRTVPVAASGYTGTPIALAIPDGTKPGTFSLQVRARDRAGNFGTWSAPLPIQWDNVAPAAPTGLKVQVTFTVTVP